MLFTIKVSLIRVSVIEAASDDSDGFTVRTAGVSGVMCARWGLPSQHVGLFFHFTIPATPSDWRSEFIVMVTSCVYNSCGVGCNVDDQRLTGDGMSQVNSAVSNSVGLCYRYWRRPCYRIHTRQLFVCGLASFDCIMYSKTSDKPEITATGNGLKWHWTVK